MTTRTCAALGLLLSVGCAEKKAEPLKSLAPAPLPRLAAGPDDAGSAEDREALYRVEPAPVHGRRLPADAVEVPLEAKAQVPPGEGPVLLTPHPEAYLAEVAPLLAALADSGRPVYLQHPAEKVAYAVTLKDEEAFRAWLDEAKPGKVRVIQRADGFELQTNVGKLPGADPNGPTVPLRGGQWDLALLRRGLSRLKERFDTSPDVCFVPSFASSMSSVAASLSADYRAPEEPIFERLCLVFPRPR